MLMLAVLSLAIGAAAPAVPAPVQTANEAWAPLPTAAPATAPAAWRSSSGYQQTRWGMTKDEVRKFYPKAVDVNGDLGVRTKVASREALLLFGFVDSGLSVVSIKIIDDNETPAERLKAFADVRSGLQSKYGASDDSEVWSPPAMKDVMPDKASGVQLGYLRLSSRWQDVDTKVNAFCEKKRNEIQIGVFYSSLALEQQTRAKARSTMEAKNTEGL